MVPVGDGEESALLVPGFKSIVMLEESDWELPAPRSELLQKESVLPSKDSEPFVLNSERH